MYVEMSVSKATETKCGNGSVQARRTTQVIPPLYSLLMHKTVLWVDYWEHQCVVKQM